MDKIVAVKLLIIILLMKSSICTSIPLSVKKELGREYLNDKVRYNLDTDNSDGRTNSTSTSFNHLDLLISSRESYHHREHLKWTLEEMCFMFIILIILVFHLAFLEFFIRLTRTRFQNNGRYNYYATVTVMFAFLVAVINMLMVIRLFQNEQYCF